MDFDRRNFIKGLSAASALSITGGGMALAAGSPVAKVKIPSRVETRHVKSTCVNCVNFCGIDVKMENDTIRAIYPDEQRAPFYNHGICPKGVSGLFNTYNPYRIKKPLMRTNPKKGLDVDPGWKEVTWDTAFAEITKRMKKIREEDPAKFIWQHGHGKYLIGDKFCKAFAKAYGTPNLVHRTTTCEAARHVADEITWGYHGFLPDLSQCRLLVNFGGNYYEAEQFSRWLDHSTIDAQQNGMQVVAVEPRLSAFAAKADQWIPVRPAKDVVLLLGIARELVRLGHVDEPFLTEYTNAPILTDENGKALKNSDGVALVWDTVSQSAKAFTKGVTPALKGSFTVNGVKVRTAHDLFVDSLSDITPEYVAEVAGIEAEQVRSLAKQIGEQAMIGATVMVDGKPARYRPVMLHTFRGLSAKQYGVQNWRAALMVQMLIGSIDAVGGINLHSVYKKPAYFDASKAEYPPSRVDLQTSVFFPHATHNVAQQVSLSLLEPKKFGLTYTPEMQIFYATNRPFSASDSRRQFEGLKETYNVTIDIVMSETAWMSDIVLPDLSYLESWHFSPTRYTPNAKHSAIRQPVTNAYNIPHDGYSIIWELAKRLGIRDEYIKNINKNWKLADYPMESGRDYTAKEAVEKIWLQNTKGKDFDIALKEGFVGKHIPLKKTYFGGVESKFKGPDKPKMKFYADQLVETLENVKAQVNRHNIKAINIDEYSIALSPIPLKEHAFPTPHKEATDFPFYLITFKHIFRNQSANNSMNPILNSLGPDTQENAVVINTKTAQRLGITAEDRIVIETRVGKVSGKVRLTEGIRPDTVAVSYHFGQQSPGLPDQARTGIWINSILESHSDVVSGMNSYNDSKCKIYKA